MGLQGTTGGDKGLLGGDKGLQRDTKSNNGLQRVTKG